MKAGIRCPRCGASYRLKPGYLPTHPVRFRCPRCQGTFLYTPQKEKQNLVSGETEESQNEDESILPFSEAGEPPVSEPGAAPAAAATESRGEGKRNKSGERNLGRHHVKVTGNISEQLHAGKEWKGHDFYIPEEDFEVGDPSTGDTETGPYESDRERGEFGKSSRRRRKVPEAYHSSAKTDRGQFRTLVFLVCAVVAFYAVLTGSFYARPDRAQALVASIPLIGQGVGEERLWARRVRLQEVQGTIQQTRDGRPALVITGQVVNTATRPLQAVQLWAEVLQQDGRVLAQRTVFVGNMVSARVLRDLTPQEISILQQLSPPRQFVIAPGEAAPFAIVFTLEPDKHGEGRTADQWKFPSEFRVKVLAARRQG